MQISMYGRNVDLFFRKNMVNALNQKYLPLLINIVICYFQVPIMHCVKAYTSWILISVNLLWMYTGGSSPTKKDDFHSLQVELLAEVLANHFFIRHADTRWLTLGPVCYRPIEQYDALK